MTSTTKKSKPSTGTKRNNTSMAEPVLLSVQDVGKMVGVSRSTVLRWAKERPEFPKSVRFGLNTARWKASEIAEWIDNAQSGQEG